MDAGSSEGAGAGSDGEFAAFEVSEEGDPFLVGGGGGRYSVLGRSARRRAMKARWASMASHCR